MPTEELRPSFRTHLPLVIGLVVLWLSLWGHIDLIAVVTGFAFSIGVVWAFQLPPIELTGRLNLWWLAVLSVKVVIWVIRASAEVAWLTFRPQPKPGSAILAYRMRAHSDWLLTMAALINMFVPGTVVVDVDRTRGIIYLHVFDADTDKKLQAARRDAHRIEDAIALAIGGRDDLHRINEWRADHDYPSLAASRRQRKYEARVEAEWRRQETAWEGDE